MSILQSLESTAADLLTQVGPMADKMKGTADDLMDRLGAESRQLTEVMGDRIAAQLENVSDSTLKRFNLVTAKKSRRRMLWGLLLGLLVGALVMAFVNQKNKTDGQLRTGGWDQEPAASGDLPK